MSKYTSTVLKNHSLIIKCSIIATKRENTRGFQSEFFFTYKKETPRKNTKTMNATLLIVTERVSINVPLQKAWIFFTRGYSRVSRMEKKSNICKILELYNIHTSYYK